MGGANASNNTDVDTSNVVPLVVDRGPDALSWDYINGLYATITLCEPDTTNCQTIDHLLVDTGSTGLRVLGSELSLNLPGHTNRSDETLVECVQFVSGSAWGPLHRADVRLGDQRISSLPIQVIGESRYPVPEDCTGTPINDMNSLGAKGILGVGLFLQDCGTACSVTVSSNKNPGLYYACQTTGAATCSITAVSLSEQIPNPIARLSEDNNGIVIDLPAVPEKGTGTVNGALYLGIGTRTNNTLGSATPLAVNNNGLSYGYYGDNHQWYQGFLDSGSNSSAFLDATTTGLPTCKGSTNWYCPASTESITLGLRRANGELTKEITFDIANTASLVAADDLFAFDNLVGPVADFSTDTNWFGFDLGLSFHFGRRIFVAIEEQSTPAGVGPFFAL
jgi:hypothetical protein